MSADTSRPEPVDAEFEPAPGGAATANPAKARKPRSDAGPLKVLGIAVLAASVGGGTGWLMGRYLPGFNATGSAPDPALLARIEALEANTATEPLLALQARLEGLEALTAGQDLRTQAFEQLVRDVSALRDRITTLETAEPARSDAPAAAPDLSALENRIETGLADLAAQITALQTQTETALATAQTAQSAVQQRLTQSPVETSTPVMDPGILTTLQSNLEELGRRIEALSAQVNASPVEAAELLAVTDRLTALENALAILQGQTTQGVMQAQARQAASTSLAHRALAFSELAEAAARSQAFAMEYAMFSQAWPDAPGLPALMTAARTGAPTLSELTTRFPADAIRQASGESRRLWGVIDIRRADGANGAVDQILTLLSEGRLQDAVDQTRALDASAAQTTVSPWLDSAQMRLDLDAGLMRLRQTLRQEAEAED